MATDTMALARSAWAIRRLTGGAAPAEGGWGARRAAFLGREKNGYVADLAEAMEGLVGLHPVVQAAALPQMWRLSGRIDPVSVAGDGGYAALVAQGTPELRLVGWLTCIDLSLRAGLALCEQVAA